MEKVNFETLLKKISPTLKRITYRLNYHFTFFNDEDLFQEALIHLWQDFNAGELSDKTDSYILQGCYFHLKNYLRKHLARARFVSIEASLNEEKFTLEGSLSLEDEKSSRYLDDLHTKMLIEAIRNNGLSPREKEVFNFLSQNLTTRQIGERLGVSHVSVVKIISRIREKCKKHLD
ncbi:MAG: sigma-70 family RNA polymerase sigma factor [Candidatus Omnitrophica bacterium]|nr:sigma-70 family RNA polymerase sigma factor [Candidatus Omnitrophota bacterium]MBU1869657.1 sigma-70 family RNA polymerase sigma factor [Candidatus Omnitrophota bacterium]